jgi:NAD(P)-dependent dehydrogenase (short-subunit alcohol dehydrogenase family)
MELGLAGKTVIVTGGASNIGRAITLAFAREGSNVVIADIDDVQGKRVADQANQLGGKTIVIKTDVTKYPEVESMVKKTIEEFKKIDVLVNNVGWDIPQLFIDTTEDFWDKVISINYRSDLNCIKAVLPYMIEQKSGAIVSIGSDAGRVGEFREAVYSGCKAGVIALSKAVAREVGRYGIRLNVVCPGVVVPSPDEIGERSMWKGETSKFFTPEVQEKAAKSYALRRLGKADDVAKAVVFLASDAASYITGQTLSVSGGYSMM